MSMDEYRVVTEVRRVSLRELRLWVREGWVKPAQGPAGPVFDELDLARVRLLCDLRKEMALPLATLPVVLTLLDRLHETRRNLQCLTEAVADQPEEVRRAILAGFRLRTGETRGADDEG